MFGGSKAQFLFATNKNICDERAEVSHAICAKFSGVFANFTATPPPTF